MIDWAKIAYTGMTQRYNYLNGSDNLNVHYEGDIPQSVRDEFEATIKKIPFEYRKNLVYLRVSDKNCQVRLRPMMPLVWLTMRPAILISCTTRQVMATQWINQPQP